MFWQNVKYKQEESSMSNRAKLRQKELKKQQERAAENRAANPEKYSTNNVIKGRKNGLAEQIKAAPAAQSLSAIQINSHGVNGV